MINWFLSSKLKEPLSGLSHLFGMLLSVAGMLVLIYLSFLKGSTIYIIAFTVYGISLILLYSASAIYHLLPLDENGRLSLLKFDQTMIFVLIAGTYTPVCLIALRGDLGINLLISIWIIALIGISLRLMFDNLPGWVPVIMYLVMGFYFITAYTPVMNAIPEGALKWLVSGGFFYTTGTLVYALKRPVIIPKVLESHELWHFFVLVGSFCHFWMMLKYIITMD
ncbi:MAG: PAQR family membrane homeostasis protein TrhA [Bacillota bacterium]